MPILCLITGKGGEWARLILINDKKSELSSRILIVKHSTSRRMNIQEHAPIRIGGGHLSNSYSHGFNYATVVNTSQIPPIIEDRVKSPQVIVSPVHYGLF